MPGCGVGALYARLWLSVGAFRGLACKSKGHTRPYAPRSPSTTLQKKLGFLNSKLWAYLTDEPILPRSVDPDRSKSTRERQGAALRGPLSGNSHVTHSANEP